MLNPAFGCQTSTTYRPGATRRYAAADSSSTSGGSTSVRGQVRSPRISGGRRWLCCRQPACLQPRPLRHGTDRRYRLLPPTVGIINLYVLLYCIVRTAARRPLQHKSPQYTTDCCIHTSDIARRQHLRSAGCHQLFVPRHRRSMFGRRACSVAGPAACNSLPDYLRDRHVPLTVFAATRTLFFSRFTSVHSALEALRLCATYIYY